MPRLSTVSGHGKPLQPALPGRRAGADSHLQTNGCVTHTVQPPGRRAPHPPGVDHRHPAQPDRPGRHGQIRLHQRAGSGDRAPGAHAGRALHRKDAANRIGLALGQGRCVPIIGATKAAHFDDAAAALNVRRRMWPIWSSRICPTRSWAPSTRTRQRALFCWTKRNKPFCNAKQQHRGTSAG